ncbi:PhzF family phenazine biosynthesis protein [Taklimakanibacter deserti]|uniref:PhzF family phenazine biosynthesis protein n=1 Tax=Taklimakanibacter deserti TaxID=2267839 RepID=UPI000E65BC63
MTKDGTLPFYLVDVFAVEPLTGNPLSVVDGGADLPLEVFRRIAREFNQSETTFVLPPTRPGADWRLRSFSTEGVEVFGAGGHNTLGAWWWLAESGRLTLSEGGTGFHQEIGDRVLPLSISAAGGKPENIIMDQEAAVAHKRLENVEALAAALGLAAEDIVQAKVPAQVVSTGAEHLLVPIRDRETVDRIKPDTKALLSVLQSVAGEGCYVFSLDTRLADTTAYARFFNPTIGILEDPATGTAAGPLAYHLVSHGLARPGKIRIEQGTAMGRPSIIQADIHGSSVKIHGRGVISASGKLRFRTK